MINIITSAIAAFTIGTVTVSDVYPDPSPADVTSISIRQQQCKSASGKCWFATVNTCVKSKVEGVPVKCSASVPKEITAESALSIIAQ